MDEQEPTRERKLTRRHPLDELALEKRRERRKLVIVACGVALGCVALTYFFTSFVERSHTADQATVQASQNAGAANTNKQAADKLCDQIKNLGRTCVVNPGNLPTPQAPVSPPPGPAGQNATDAQVRDAVSLYFASHPVQNGKDASPAEIAAAVTNYLHANPPTPGAAGQNATPSQIASAVKDYLIANPPAKGDKGDPGENATPEQIATAVKDYMVNHPMPACPSGSELKAITVVTSSPAGTQDIITCVVN